MPYNLDVDDRISEIVKTWEHINSKKMFGGVCYLIHGNMFCGVYKDYLILRLGESAANDAFKMPHVLPFDITGRPMKGWIMVNQAGFDSKDKLAEWLKKAKEFALSLSPK